MAVQSPEEQAAEDFRELHMSVVQTLISLGLQLGAWLVGGNAAALVVVVNAILATPVAAAAANQARIWFCIGLFSAFLSVVISYFNGMLFGRWMQRARDALGELLRTKEMGGDTNAANLNFTRALPLPFVVIVLMTLTWLLYIASCAFFVVGALTPIPNL